MTKLRNCLFLLFFLIFAFGAGAVLAENLLIVEVQIAGEKTDNDFIKIYNPGNNDLDIAGYKLRKKSSTGKEYSIIVIGSTPKNFRNTIIPAKGYFLWANSKDDFRLNLGADVWSSQTLAKNNSIALLNPENEIIDVLAWGESQNPFVSGSPFPKNPEPDQKLTRKQVNEVYQDTNNNANDFYLNPSSGFSQLNVETSPKEEPQSITEEFAETGSPQTIVSPAEPEKNVEIKENEPLRIDINSALLKELQKLTGIGPVLAQRIIDARPFYSLDELAKVSGIGPKALEDIKKQGLAWVDPELEPPKIEKSNSREIGSVGTAEISKLFDFAQAKQTFESILVFLVATILAIFSGIIILLLKRNLTRSSKEVK